MSSEVGDGVGGFGSSASDGMLRALQSELNVEGVEGVNAEDPFHWSSVHSLPPPASSWNTAATVDRVLVRFPALHTEQWFTRGSEELCVPGTHVTSKRKEKGHKTNLPPSVRKQQPRSSLSSSMSSMSSSATRLMQLGGVSESVCHRALAAHHGDLPSASAWLFTHAGATSLLQRDAVRCDLSHLEKGVKGGTAVVAGARHYTGGKSQYHTTSSFARDASFTKEDQGNNTGSTIGLWVRGLPASSIGSSIGSASASSSASFSGSSSGSSIGSFHSSSATSSDLLFMDGRGGAKRETKDGTTSGTTSGTTTDRREYLLVKGQKACHGLCSGAKVRALYGGHNGGGGQTWYDGRIRNINTDGTCTVVYTDGDVQLSVPRKNLRLSPQVRISPWFELGLNLV